MNISDSIVATYESRLDELSPKRRFHWLLRRFRTTGLEKYVPLIRNSFEGLVPEYKDTLITFSDRNKILELGKKQASGYEHLTPRRTRRFDYYKENPEIMVYKDAIFYMFLIKSLGMENSELISQEYKIAKSYFEKNDVARLFLDKDFLITNPSGSANSINFLAFLGFTDLRDESIKLSKEYWLSVSPEDSSTWLDKIFALTHQIIAASAYYQNFVSKEKYDWIFDYFEKNTDEILKKANLDNVAEMALTFKLVKDFDNPIIGKVKDYLSQRYDREPGFISHDRRDGLGDAEHRNIIATMVLEDFDRLYKGPNLGDLK